MQRDQLAMQEQLRAAEDRSAAATGNLALQKQHGQQLLAACEPLLALVRTCVNVLSLASRAVSCSAQDRCSVHIWNSTVAHKTMLMVREHATQQWVYWCCRSLSCHWQLCLNCFCVFSRKLGHHIEKLLGLLSRPAHYDISFCRHQS